jgi:hypothetical protein
MSVRLRTGRRMARQVSDTVAERHRAPVRARREARGPTPRCARCLAYGVPLDEAASRSLCRACAMAGDGDG